jgi:LacI family transcriptional regulator
VQGRHIDGAIVFLTGSMPVTSYDPVLAALRQRVPIVWAMGMEVTAGGVDHITPDNIRTGCIAHNYLVGEGCKHLAFLTTDPGWAFIRLRGQAFLNSAVDAANPATAYLVGSSELVAQAYGRRVVLAPTLDQIVAQMVAADPRPTGIFVDCDRTTAQLYPVLARHGLQVGRDVTLVSCDNEQIRLSALHPRPASIDIGAEEIGFRSVVRLLARLRRPHEGPVVIQVSPRLAFSELPPQSATELITESNRQPTAAV